MEKYIWPRQRSSNHFSLKWTAIYQGETIKRRYYELVQVSSFHSSYLISNVCLFRSLLIIRVRRRAVHSDHALSARNFDRRLIRGPDHNGGRRNSPLSLHHSPAIIGRECGEKNGASRIRAEIRFDTRRETRITSLPTIPAPLSHLSHAESNFG